MLAVLALLLNLCLFALIRAPTPSFEELVAVVNLTSRGRWELHGNAFVWSFRFPSAQQQHAVVGFGTCDISMAMVVRKVPSTACACSFPSLRPVPAGRAR